MDANVDIHEKDQDNHFFPYLHLRVRKRCALVHSTMDCDRDGLPSNHDPKNAVDPKITSESFGEHASLKYEFLDFMNFNIHKPYDLRSY
jgi:hypothetical protein